MIVEKLPALVSEVGKTKFAEHDRYYNNFVICGLMEEKLLLLKKLMLTLLVRTCSYM